MTIGLSTTDFHISKPADDLFSKIAGLGFKSIQLSFAAISECDFVADGVFEIPCSVPEATLQRIKAAAIRHDLRIECLTGTFNMAHPDPEQRAQGVARFHGLGRAARALGCPMISLCTGSRCKDSMWRGNPGNEDESAWRDMAEVMRQLIGIAEQWDLVLAIETEASNVVNTPERACRILDEMGSSHLKMIIDCANLFHSGQACVENMRPAIRRAFSLYGNDIALAHGKDIKAGPGIEFCATGEGIVDFDFMLEMLDQVGYNGDMILHGIYDELKMTRSLEFMRAKIAAR